MAQNETIIGIARPVWRAVHALGATWLEEEQRRMLVPRLFVGVGRFVGAVAAVAVTRPEMAERAAAMAARQRRAEIFLVLRDQFARLQRLCGDSYLTEQAAALAEAESLLDRLRQGAPSPALFDPIMLLARRAEQKRQAGLRGRRLRPVKRTARRSDRAALRGALQSLWRHLGGTGADAG